jgi:hypothetical protein
LPVIRLYISSVICFCVAFLPYSLALFMEYLQKRRSY